MLGKEETVKKGKRRAVPTIIATLHPYVDHRSAIISHPLVGALRYNSINPVAEPKSDVLARLANECGRKTLWIDLKAKQLRITRFAYLPYAFVELSHKISVNLPAWIYFRESVSKVVEIVDGNKLILSRKPLKVVGDGEPVNILDPSLKIEGCLTDDDRGYIEAASELGIHHYMLSFTESVNDLSEVFALDREAQIMAKIESQRGIDFVSGDYLKLRMANRGVRLMAARDDLFINVGDNKARIYEALGKIVEADKNAVVASRLLTSLERGPVSMADLSDWILMSKIGFKSFMLSDFLCFEERSFLDAMGVIAAMNPEEAK